MIRVILGHHWEADSTLGCLACSREVSMNAQMCIVLELKLLLLLARNAHLLARGLSRVLT